MKFIHVIIAALTLNFNINTCCTGTEGASFTPSVVPSPNPTRTNNKEESVFPTIQPSQSQSNFTASVVPSPNPTRTNNKEESVFPTIQPSLNSSQPSQSPIRPYEIDIDKSIYLLGESIYVDFVDPEAALDHWIGLYKSSLTVGEDDGLVFDLPVAWLFSEYEMTTTQSL